MRQKLPNLEKRDTFRTAIDDISEDSIQQIEESQEMQRVTNSAQAIKETSQIPSPKEIRPEDGESQVELSVGTFEQYLTSLH